MNHKGSPSVRCFVCGKVLADSSSLYRHRKIHSDERAHVCKLCPRRFIQRFNMRQHQKTHRDTITPQEFLILTPDFQETTITAMHEYPKSAIRREPFELLNNFIGMIERKEKLEFTSCPRLFLSPSNEYLVTQIEYIIKTVIQAQELGTDPAIALKMFERGQPMAELLANMVGQTAPVAPALDDELPEDLGEGDADEELSLIHI